MIAEAQTKNRVIGFVILTWNSEKYIHNCLHSILNMDKIQSHIVVVDNGSTDKTIQILNEFTSLKNVKIHFLKENKGTTISRNIGIKDLTGDCRYICILDSDTVVNESAILGMISVLDENESNGIVGPLLYDSKGVIQNSGRKIPSLKVKLLKIVPFKKISQKGEDLEKYNAIESSTQYAVGYLMSACWVIKSEVFKNIGLLDEAIFYAPEDVEFCIRAWKSGYRVLYVPKEKIIHEWQRLSRKKIFSKHNYEHVKGLLYLYRKYRFWFNAEKIERLVK